MMRGVAWFLLCGLVPVAAQAKLDLHLPVDCIIGENCFIQNYFDHKAEAGAVRDYTCGNMSYDGHNGTDFRVPTYADLQQGIAVLAAADGTVKAVQVAPVFNEADIPMLKLIKLGMHNPCGSLIRIDHGKGWESFYCHLDAEGNRVKTGDAVKAGQVIGRMGRSGESLFPHLHYELRHHATPVDPFVGYANNYDCATSERFGQWSDEVAQELAYDIGGLVAGGFTAETPDPAKGREGQQREERLAADAAALNFWVELYGLRRYDRLEIRLTAPDGRELAKKRVDFEKPLALVYQPLTLAREQEAWQKGSYMAEVTLLRFEHVLPQTVATRRWLVDVE